MGVSEWDRQLHNTRHINAISHWKHDWATNAEEDEKVG